MVLQLLSLLLLLQNSSAYIVYLNDSEYTRMPPVFHLDRYDTCLHANNDSWVYCSAKFALVTDEPSELYDMIRNYSAKTETHFNHTELFYGICITKSCKHLYEQNTTQDQAVTLEACLNNSLWEDYKLKARIINCTCENGAENTMHLDTSDIAVAIAILILLMLNILGTLQDVCCVKKSCKGGNTLLSCFSLRHNWIKMIAPTSKRQDSRLEHFKGFYGIRAMTMMVMITIHSGLLFVLSTDNTHFLEEVYREWFSHLLTDSALTVQTFFVMSGFFLAYNMQLDSEKQKITLLTALSAVIKRYIRLTVPFAFVLAVTATWARHLGQGPFWQSLVVTEVEDCRRDWWLNLLYIINYVDNSYCMSHSWYLAADFQLYIVGVVICALTAGLWRKSILTLLFFAGVVTPAVHTYLRDLDGALITSPEYARNLVIKDETFNHVYKRGHTNIASFVIGLALGQLIYHWQTTGYKFQKDAKRRFLMWVTYPVMNVLVLLAMVFYLDGPRVSIYIRVLYAAFIKPAFSGVLSVLIIGMVFEFEDVYRGVLEWPMWVVPSQLSYCTYIVHILLIKLLIGTNTTLSNASLLHMCEVIVGNIFVSFLAAIPLHLLVEAPTLRLVKLCSGNTWRGNANYIFNSKAKHTLDRDTRQLNKIKVQNLQYQ